MKNIKRSMKKIAKKTVPGLVADRDVLRHIHTQVDNIFHAQQKLEAAISKQSQSHDNRLDKLKSAVKKVEPYQPLYNVSGVINVAARSSKNRAIAIESYLENIKGMRMLDLGSSLGYMCFYFADRGAITEGWDYNPKNVVVEKLTQQINGIGGAKFLTKGFDSENILQLDGNKHDVALVLSVFHHITYYRGLEYTQQLIAELFKKVPVVIMELAQKDEDKKLPWNDSQPSNELDILALVKDQVEIKQIGSFGNHLSSKKRPLYAVRKKKQMKVNNKNYTYDHMLTEAYKDSPVTYSKHHRRYYFTNERVIKEYIFDANEPNQNQRQIINEINVLNNLLVDSNVHHAPKLLDYEPNTNTAKVVLSKISGVLISDLETPLSLSETRSVAKDVLSSLSDLRKHGLYHNDVRSWNIVFNKKEAWLIDYGLTAPTSTDSDPMSLIWALHAGLTGEREAYSMNKASLPDKKVFLGDSALVQLYEGIKAGTTNPDELLSSFNKAKVTSKKRTA